MQKREIKTEIESPERRAQRAALESRQRRLVATKEGIVKLPAQWNEQGGYAARVDNPVRSIMRDTAGDGCRARIGDRVVDSHRWTFAPTRRRTGFARFVCVACEKVRWSPMRSAPQVR